MKTIILESARLSLPVLIIVALGVSVAVGEVVPTAELMDAGPLDTVEHLELASVDLAAAALEDADREAESGVQARKVALLR